jgi:hypothetical protein
MIRITGTSLTPARPKTEPTDKRPGGEGRIRCPLCQWEPQAQDRWMCNCRYSWNTFDTGGVCPGCLKQWMMTVCLDCHKWSPHSDWYPKD